MTTTVDEDSARGAATGSLPGLLIVYADARPRALVLSLVDGALELGREELAALNIADSRASRRHVRVEHDGERWAVHDLGSRNGTFVDGRPVQRALNLAAPVVRIGRTVMLAVPDCRRFVTPGVVVRDGVVMGPATQAVHERVAVVARSGASLLIQGGSGAGKELAAGAFHTAAGAAGASRPFVAVNCATIQKELAEATLFGARRGAFTGAVADTTGLVRAADGGTLFLDEIAELEPGVQAKLLRVLETRSVTPVGGVSPVAVNIRVCAATLKNLRGEVAAGRFREDLYFRIGRPEVRLPALAARREEVPWLIARALETSPGPARLAPSAEFVEACLLRQWPGNVRELLAEVSTAALAATARQQAVIAAADLDAEAGQSIQPAPPDQDAAAAAADRDERADADRAAAARAVEPGEIEAALRAEQGNVARAAARLGLARSRVRRFIERARIDVRAFRPG